MKAKGGPVVSKMKMGGQVRTSSNSSSFGVALSLRESSTAFLKAGVSTTILDDGFLRSTAESEVCSSGFGRVKL